MSLILQAAATNDNNFWFCEASSRPLMGPCHAASSNLSEAFRGVSFFEWHENGLLLSVSKLGSVVLWRADGKPVAERLGDVQAQARHMHQRLVRIEGSMPAPLLLLSVLCTRASILHLYNAHCKIERQQESTLLL